jgi:hypothetical protein
VVAPFLLGVGPGPENSVDADYLCSLENYQNAPTMAKRIQRTASWRRSCCCVDLAVADTAQQVVALRVRLASGKRGWVFCRVNRICR